MSIKFLTFLFLTIFVHNQVFSEIRILTFHCNKPEFIEIQYKTLKKFMLDDYELIVFNDAKDPTFKDTITAVCEKYGIRCIDYPQDRHSREVLNYEIVQWLKDPFIQDIHHFAPDPIQIGQHPSVRHCHVIKYALENFGFNHHDIVVLLDGDAFPIRPFSIRSLLKDCHIAGIQKGFAGIDYLWVVFVAFDMRTLPNKNKLKFDLSVINHVIHDTGSYTYHFLRENPNVLAKKYPGIGASFLAQEDVVTLLNKGYTAAEIELIKKNDWPPVEFHMDNHLFHFSTGSFNFPGYEQKEVNVKNFIHKILQDP